MNGLDLFVLWRGDAMHDRCGRNLAQETGAVAETVRTIGAIPAPPLAKAAALAAAVLRLTVPLSLSDVLTAPVRHAAEYVGGWGVDGIYSQVLEALDPGSELSRGLSPAQRAAIAVALTAALLDHLGIVDNLFRLGQEGQEGQAGPAPISASRNFSCSLANQEGGRASRQASRARRGRR